MVAKGNVKRNGPVHSQSSANEFAPEKQNWHNLSKTCCKICKAAIFQSVICGFSAFINFFQITLFKKQNFNTRHRESAF